MPRKKENVLDRFWRYVANNEADGCWEWTGARHTNGYGVFTPEWREGVKFAHRVSYSLYIGTIPTGMNVCHHCDNPPCVRPDHLFLGTHQDNADDRVRKGRGAVGDRSGARLHPERLLRGDAHPARNTPGWGQGVKNGRAIFTEDQVREQRERFASGESIASLARAYNCGWATMRDIVYYRHWRHVA